eukprot:45817-Amphidinium_carterae.2
MESASSMVVHVDATLTQDLTRSIHAMMFPQLRVVRSFETRALDWAPYGKAYAGTIGASALEREGQHLRSTAPSVYSRSGGRHEKKNLTILGLAISKYSKILKRQALSTWVMFALPVTWCRGPGIDQLDYSK